MIAARSALLGAAAVAALLLAAPAGAQHTPGVPGWQQDVHYSLAVTYAPPK